MASSPINELLAVIERVRRRRILILHLRQIGWSLAFLSTLFILSALSAMALPPVTAVSVLLFSILVIAAAALVWKYGRSARRFNAEDRQLAHYIDERTPDLEQRLLTAMDVWDKNGTQPHSQLITSLWRDTLTHVAGENLQRTADARPTWFAAAAAFSLILLLASAIWYSDRFADAARRVIWPLPMHSLSVTHTAALAVSPGDILIRRGSDVTISVTIETARSKSVLLHTREGADEWQPLTMQTSDSTNRFQHLLHRVSSDMDYYVTSGYRRSPQFRIQVFDLTRVDSIAVDYRYPAYTGIESKTEQNSGDIMAPEGTQVDVQVAFDSPVQSALLRFEQGPAVQLTVADTTATGTFTVTQDDAYVVDALDTAGRHVEHSARYLVRAAPDIPPTISIIQPGRDMRVMALEEVRIAVSATDDYGLTRLALQYNVGGTREYIVDLLHTTGKEKIEPLVETETLIYLEDLNVAPGDVISYFLTARDNNGVTGPAEATSDIYFLEVINTDEAFRRASGPAGGMGQGGRGRPPSALVENQKNIIAATWKLLMRQRGTPGEGFDNDVGVVAESQRSLAQRTQMSLARLTERFSFADETYDRSVLHLSEAVDQMQAAVEKLSSRSLAEALGPEQAALQAILKAEAQSRQTALQMASNTGGGAGYDSSQREREDLRELFDMEMGRLENRYEMPRTGAGAGRGEADEALRRLRELAQRQERLNRAQLDAERRKHRMTAAQQQRRLEELRREQDALRREAQALSQRWSRQAAGTPLRSSLNALDQAVNQMRETARNLAQGDPGEAAASGQLALRRLKDQEKRMQRRRATVNDLIKSLGERAKQLQAQESEIVRDLARAGSAADQETGSASRQVSADTQAHLLDIIAKKEALADTITDTEDLIRALGSKSNTTHPEVARRTRDVRRVLTSESLQKRIDESKADLRSGRLKMAMEKEIDIERAIARLGGRLQAIEALAPTSGEERLQAAARAAEALEKELENLRQTLATRDTPPKGSSSAPGRGDADQGGEANRVADGLERSRQLARGLVQPWAAGEDWSADARSIHRELTNAQIEDFLKQPALWQKLVEPVRELAAALREQLADKGLGDTPFSPSGQAPPPHYESMVETYFRSLSDIEMENR
ncbi:MAG: hypothetical protein QNJ22_15085 [Desulfosarcinaceae bacterium]|nr:hypothetical protein [Desulfosarcinaceae bacterium]